MRGAFSRSSCPRPKCAAAPVSCGSSFRNASIRSASKRKNGGNCHRIGPSFGPSRSRPDAMKFASGVSASRSRRMCVMKRGAFTANTKSSGTRSAQSANASGRCMP